MPVLEGKNDTFATDDLDEVVEKLDMHMATLLMKAECVHTRHKCCGL
jgi:hypothetical protein